MAIALRGSAGAVATAATGSITPAFGQATASGNLLVAIVAAHIASQPVTMTFSTTASGWDTSFQSSVGSAQPTTSGILVAFKPNCSAGETAPTFTITGSPTQVSAYLVEFTGVATTSPVDTSSNSLSGLVTGVDNALIISGYSDDFTKSCTVTYADVYTGTGSTVAAQGDGATKQAFHLWGSCRITTDPAGTTNGNSRTVTPSTGALNIANGYRVSFKPVSTVVTPRPVAMVVKQALNRAANW